MSHDLNNLTLHTRVSENKGQMEVGHEGHKTKALHTWAYFFFFPQEGDLLREAQIRTLEGCIFWMKAF